MNNKDQLLCQHSFKETYELNTQNYFYIIQETSKRFLDYMGINKYEPHAYIKLYKTQTASFVYVIFPIENKKAFIQTEIKTTHELAEIFSVHLAQSLCLFLIRLSGESWDTVVNSPTMTMLISQKKKNGNKN